MKQRKLSSKEKLELWFEQNDPTSERSPLVEAVVEIKEFGAMDFNFQGMPPQYGLKALVVLCGIYAIFWMFFSDAAISGEVYIEFDQFEKLQMLFWASLAGVGGGLMWMFIDMHKGTFTNYEWVINAFWRFLDGRNTIPTELRVIEVTRLWPFESGVKQAALSSEAFIKAMDGKKEAELAIESLMGVY